MSVSRRAVCLCFPPAAFQPPCCLPQPRTKHIAAPEQHGVLSYLAAAAAVLAPDAPLLSCSPAVPWVRRQHCATGLARRMYCTTTPPACPTATPCAGPAGGSHLGPGFGVRLEKKVLAQFVLWICYFCSLLDMVQTDRCIFFSDSL